METLQTHRYVQTAQTNVGNKKSAPDADPQEFQSLLDPKVSPNQAKLIKGNLKGVKSLKNDPLLAEHLVQLGKGKGQLTDDQAIVFLDKAQESDEIKNINVEMLETDENLQKQILSQNLLGVIPTEDNSVLLGLNPTQDQAQPPQVDRAQLEMMQNKSGIVIEDHQLKSVLNNEGKLGLKMANENVLDSVVNEDALFQPFSDHAEQIIERFETNNNKKPTIESVNKTSALDISLDGLAPAEREALLINNQDRRPERKSMFHIQKQIDELPSTHTNKSQGILIENEFDSPAQMKIISENDFAIKYQKDTDRSKIISESQLDTKSALLTANDNNQTNTSQSAMDSQIAKNLASTSEVSGAGHLQLEKLDTADAREILNQIKNHVMQMSEAGKDRAELTVNSSLLGRFKIEVERKSVGTKQDIEVTLHSQLKSGHEILVENKNDLLKHLEGAGLRVIDLKINGPGERTSLNQVGFAESQNVRYNKHEEGHQQDSQRRRELWEEAKRARS